MIDVIWLNASRGNWDSGLLSEIFDSSPDIFKQHNTKTQVVFDRAIVVIVGKPDVKQTRQYLDKFKGGHAILTSDEDSYFDFKNAIPPHFERWTQYYAPNKAEIETRILLGAPSRIKDFDTSPLEKKYLWSFVGQVQNPSRQHCVEVLKTLPNGYLHIAQGFAGTLGNEMEYQKYLDIMRQSKFVVCPSGSMCVDSFRVYEALQCGAIPIVEKRSPRDASDFNYWDSVWDLHELIQVDSWDELPEVIQTPVESVDAVEWWDFYKSVLKGQLIELAR